MEIITCVCGRSTLIKDSWLKVSRKTWIYLFAYGIKTMVSQLSAAYCTQCIHSFMDVRSSRTLLINANNRCCYCYCILKNEFVLQFKFFVFIASPMHWLCHMFMMWVLLYYFCFCIWLTFTVLTKQYLLAILFTMREQFCPLCSIHL